ncbi:MAG: tetratricopeptide repeat protein [Gemmatimonadota bacterium]
MKPRPLRVEQALDLLPEVDDLQPLRSALIEGSRADEARVWSGAEAYAMLDTRVVDAASLEGALPAVVLKVQQRIEFAYRHVVAAIRALERGDTAGAAEALVAAGEAEEGAGRQDAAAKYYRRAAELGRRGRDRRPEGLALIRLARVARSQGRLSQSLDLYRQGFEIADSEGDHEQMVVACQGLGNVNVERGAWAEAESWYSRGLELIEGEEPSRLLWQLQSNLSVVARRSGRLNASKEWLERASLTIEALGDEAGRVYVANARGLLRAAHEDHAGAEAAYRIALAAAESPMERARVLVNLAEALLNQGKPAAAETVTRRLEQIAVTHGLVASLPYAYRSLGAIARMRGDPEGFLFYEQALELCRDESLPPFEKALTQQEYARFEADSGQLDAPIARLEEARELFLEIGVGPELDAVEEQLASLQARRVDAQKHVED